ncbi:aldehyde-activating protein [Halomonas litopenaei]|uniref:Aldehyde-activating protein n=1 Tax=Halomonas litopenaei TaxID=2109328 RepID=A0ABX5J342_9GAMM|nr:MULTISPECIES: GFA family protein [Halomonas]PTL93824.1 aldehyde-activating protein [Halomonas sp. SYSU XM8]PTL96506.1 aldehyde-activating protein [Halomonas litopenaei]
MNATADQAMRLSGTCLCGAVTLKVALEQQSVGACHCQMCRTWGGGPLLALESVSQLTLEGEEAVTFYSSSDWAERAFCRHCGTHLFYRLKNGEHTSVPVGLIDSGEAWRFDLQFFIDEKPHWYHFGNDTRNLTGQELFEAFSKDT